MRVSKSKEKAMLSTVRMLRRLLRKAFFVTKRVRVMEEPQEETSSSEKLMLNMVNRLRRLLRNVLRTTKLLSVINSTDVAQPIHDVYLRSVIGGKQRTQQSHYPRYKQGCRPHTERHLQVVKTHVRRVTHRVN